MGVATQRVFVSFHVSIQAAVGVFHHVVLRYVNCTRLDLFLDNVEQSVSVSGKRKISVYSFS